jgi:hypothetical protein
MEARGKREKVKDQCGALKGFLSDPMERYFLIS